MLTPDSVSILKQQFLNLGGVKMQVGSNVRNAYMNSASGRAAVQSILSEEYQNAVFSVWGNAPTVEETAA